MKITQDVREYAARHGLDSTEAVKAGMQEKAAEFREQGGEVYLPVHPEIAQAVTPRENGATTEAGRNLRGE